MSRALGTWMFCAFAGVAQAQAQTPAPAQNTASPEALEWLRRIYLATEKLSYTGTFVYQQGDRTETSRIARRAEPAGSIEKLEVLDGSPREVVRTRDEIRCYLPDSQTVKVDRRRDQRSFPALLPAQVSTLGEYYDISMDESRRIAGYDCQAIVLAPRDELRYGYKFWADVQTGMLLKARAFNRNGETVEQFTFTQLEIGPVARERVRPRVVARTWRVEQAAVGPANLAQAGWTMRADLPGFRKVIEITRMLREAQPVGQVVYSDGLAAVSVFIEPLAGRTDTPAMGLASMGAVNVYTREVAKHLVTVVGEAPAASVQRIGDTVAYHPPQ
jgi:sigma-E factor negative regulatory protein RseB